MRCSLQGGHGWGHEEGQFNLALGSQASLQSLPKHIEAAAKLVQQLKLPDRLPLQPSGIVGTDPAKLAAGEASIHTCLSAYIDPIQHAMALCFAMSSVH